MAGEILKTRRTSLLNSVNTQPAPTSKVSSGYSSAGHMSEPSTSTALSEESAFKCDEVVHAKYGEAIALLNPFHQNRNTALEHTIKKYLDLPSDTSDFDLSKMTLIEVTLPHSRSCTTRFKFQYENGTEERKRVEIIYRNEKESSESFIGTEIKSKKIAAVKLKDIDQYKAPQPAVPQSVAQQSTQAAHLAVAPIALQSSEPSLSKNKHHPSIATHATEAPKEAIILLLGFVGQFTIHELHHGYFPSHKKTAAEGITDFSKALSGNNPVLYWCRLSPDTAAGLLSIANADGVKCFWPYSVAGHIMNYAQDFQQAGGIVKYGSILDKPS